MEKIIACLTARHTSPVRVELKLASVTSENIGAASSNPPHSLPEGSRCRRSSAYRDCHWIQGSRAQTRPRTIDF
jgi:hypothetical protein